MTRQESWRNVGGLIRQLRKANQLTLKQLAVGCSLSPNAISLVERGKVAPTIATLCKIANALGVKPGSFFEDICPTVIFSTQRKEQPRAELSEETADEGQIQYIDQENHTVHPDQILSKTVLCIGGKIEYEIGERQLSLSPGESLTLNLNQPGRWKNTGSEAGILLLVIPPVSINNPNEEASH